MLTKRQVLLLTALFLFCYIIWQEKESYLNIKPETVPKHMENAVILKGDLQVPSLISEVTTELEKVQVSRKQLISETCKSFNSTSLETLISSSVNRATLMEILVDDTDKVLYCYIPKVACSNWKRLLMVQMGKANATDPLAIKSEQAHNFHFKRLNQYTEDQIRYRLSNYLKFMFVRHPFERVLSAFRDKLNPGNHEYRSKYGRQIVKMYRNNTTTGEQKEEDLPTYREFVQHIINFKPSAVEEKLEYHWRPMEDLCMPCAIQYDIVGKYETLENDAWLVFEKVGFSRKAKFPRADVASYLTSSLLPNFMAELTEAEINQLYRVYERDFKLFGYNRDQHSSQ